MDILVGSTGFVGTHFLRARRFDVAVHRPDISTIEGCRSHLLVCAGLPAEKWRAEQDPDEDWENVCSLAAVLQQVAAERAVLISTIDVFDPPEGVVESSPTALSGSSAYGRNRAWFELFFRHQFPGSLIVRLPGLFAPDVRKNLIHDLLHRRSTYINRMSARASFQFFDVRDVPSLTERALELGLETLNVSSGPVDAGTIARIFDVELPEEGVSADYDMRSSHATLFGGSDGYLVDRNDIIARISKLRTESLR